MLGSLVLIGLAPVHGFAKPYGERDGERMVIIAPERFLGALQDFVAFKRTSRATELVSMESILMDSSGVDDPERIKRWLYREWSERGLGYVLLVGDVNAVPVRYMVLDRVTPEAFDYAFYPSDLYYGDLARRDGSFEDWNASADAFHAGYFGEVRGEKNKRDPINYDRIDYRPEVAVGRWPVESDEEVVRVAQKSMRYEQSMGDGTRQQRRRAAFLAVGGWVDTRPLMDRLALSLDPRWSSTKQYYSDTQRPSDSPPTPAATRGLLQDGVDLMVHAGHGQSDAWEQCFSIGDLDQISNASQLPIVISAGCSTAYFAPLPPYGPYVDVDGKEHVGTDQGETFDSPPPPPCPLQSGRFNPTGLGEQLLKRNEHGAVAYIGCNTGSQPCALTLLEGFVQAVGQSEHASLGHCWNRAIDHYFANEKLGELKPDSGWYPPSVFFQGMKFMLFGDPSLPLP